MGRLISVRVFTSSVFGYVGSGMVSSEFMCFWGPGAFSVWSYPSKAEEEICESSDSDVESFSVSRAGGL